MTSSNLPGADKKIVAGICAILLGSLGIHKFVLGYTQEGIVMLLVSLLTCGIGATVMWVIGLIEGIMYLTKTDEEFVSTYINGKKGWF
ncbi:MAG: TM2 domain-containing protein [Cyanobacteria bacterium P01_E01_bin.6]